MHDALAFARLAGVRHLVAFHHDPARDDAALEAGLTTMAKQARNIDQSELFPAKTLAKKAGRSPEEAARAAWPAFRPRYQGTG